MRDSDRLLLQFRSDWDFYAPRALRIRTKKGDLLPFVPNRAQRFVHEKLEAQRRIKGWVRANILKGRQQGISTYVEGRFYWKTSGEYGKKAFILTHEDKATQNLFEMAKLYHEFCPAELKPTTKKSNAQELDFDRLKSKYAVGTARTKGTGRSGTVQYFHGSEVAWWAGAKEHMAGLGQAVPLMEGTEIILETTAQAKGDPFHEGWQMAARGESDYINIFVPWFWQEEYQLPVPTGFVMDSEEVEYAEAYGVPTPCMVWRRSKLRSNDFKGDVELFNREYPATPELAFQAGSGKSFIPPTLIARAMATKVDDVNVVGPKIMGVDPAEYGDDASAICKRQGRRTQPIERFHKKGPMQLVGLVAMRADEWKPDAICVDCTGIGSGVADRLAELGYPVMRVHFGARDTLIEPELYTIRKDELYALGKAYLEDAPCEMPKDDVLEADACGPLYEYDSSRRLKIESKEKMKKRGLKSPDSWDAFVLTHAYRGGPSLGKGVDPDRPYNWRTGA